MGRKQYSRQRELIYQALMGRQDHPHAEDIYQSLKPSHPSLSLGTVYRNLNHLVQEGRAVRFPFTVDRFDAVTSPHPHFFCFSCGTLFDLDFPLDDALIQKVQHLGHQVQRHEVTFKGLCAKCLEENPHCKLNPKDHTEIRYSPDNFKEELTMEFKLYRCEHCGNIIYKAFDSGVPVVCCGEKMGELKANTTDAAVEKHVPVIERSGSEIKVQVGSVLHPMTEEHYIPIIAVVNEDTAVIKKLNHTMQPTMTATLEGKVSAYEYCNLHGFWKGEE